MSLHLDNLTIKLPSSERSLTIDDVIGGDINEQFDQIVRENNLRKILQNSSRPEKIIDRAYMNLNFVTDVYDKFGDDLPEVKQELLQDLIREDAYALITARLPSDEYNLRNLLSQHEDTAGLMIDSRMRDLLALAKAWDSTDQDTSIEKGIEIIADNLPHRNTHILLKALKNASKDNKETTFEEAYEELTKNRRVNIIEIIERIGQRGTMSPSEIKNAEARGELRYPSHKERNLFKRDGDTASIIGGVALKLSKQFRK